MFFDFPTLLYFLAAISLITWVVDAIFFKPARDKDNEKVQERIDEKEALAGKPLDDAVKYKMFRRENLFVEACIAFFPIIVLVLLLRSFLFEPFRIPSDSMVPTLLNGDFILVNKYDYGLRLPITNAHIFGDGTPARGDVAVFRFPNEPTTNYIKRVVGLPGDTVEYKNKRLIITQAGGSKIPVSYSRLDAYHDVGAGREYSTAGYYHFQETLDGVEHNILVLNFIDNPKKYEFLKHNGGKFTVPKGHYFVLGDNRDNSNDSRFWGLVPQENLVGRAFAVWLNFDPYMKSVRFGRMFQGIQ